MGPPKTGVFFLNGSLLDEFGIYFPAIFKNVEINMQHKSMNILIKDL